MIELVNDPTERSPDFAASAANLMHHYGFDLGGYTFGGHTITQLLLEWQAQYPASWIRLATIEALYQGRYKAISVEQILALWQRRGQPIYHFNHEFERLIYDRLPQTLTPPAPSTQEEAFSTRSAQAMVAKLPYRSIALPYPSFEAIPTLQGSDAMQALRTLHNDATDSPLADSLAESNELLLPQPYSHPLRSEEPLSHRSTHEQSKPLTQSHVDPPLVSSALLPSVLLPSDCAASASTVGDEPLQAGSIASTNTRSDVEQADSIKQTGTTLPVSNGTQAQPTTPQAASIARILQQLDDQELSAKTMFPGVGLLAQTLKPKLRLHLTACYQPIWLTDPSSKQPIHQFTPDPEASDFHSKLKLVAQVPERLLEGESCEPPPHS